MIYMYVYVYVVWNPATSATMLMVNDLTRYKAATLPLHIRYKLKFEGSKKQARTPKGHSLRFELSGKMRKFEGKCGHKKRRFAAMERIERRETPGFAFLSFLRGQFLIDFIIHNSTFLLPAYPRPLNLLRNKCNRLGSHFDDNTLHLSRFQLKNGWNCCYGFGEILWRG